MDNTTPDAIAAVPAAAPAMPVTPVSVTPAPALVDAATVTPLAQPSALARIEAGFSNFATAAEAAIKEDTAAIKNVADRRWPQLIALWKSWDVKHRVAAGVAGVVLVFGAAWFSHAIWHGTQNIYHSSRNFLAGDTVSHEEMKAGDAKTLKDAKTYAASAGDLAAVREDVTQLKAQAGDVQDVREEIDALKKQLEDQKPGVPAPAAKTSKSKTTHRAPVRKSTSWWSGLVSQ